MIKYKLNSKALITNKLDPYSWFNVLGLKIKTKYIKFF